MSAYTNPFFIGPTGSGSMLLERIPLEKAPGSMESERWLQEALFAHPESIPLKEIDPHIGPLIPIAMEIETGSGPADILFLTPTGQVVLVETKLWRSPQARRAVVGQILDYAKQLTTWTFDVLDNRAAVAAKAQSGHLLACLRSRHSEASEVAFVDGVGRSLATGDFLLLIVGDGIRVGAEALVSFLERYGHLRFGLGLLEVAGYRLPDGGMVLQPRVLAKTEVLQRTIFVGEGGPVTFHQAPEVGEEGPQAQSQKELGLEQERAWYQEFWSEYLPQLRLDDPSLVPLSPAKSTTQYFVMPPNGAKAWICATVSPGSGQAGVYLAFASSYDRRFEVYELLENDREAIEREVGTKLKWDGNGARIRVAAPDVMYSDLNDSTDRKRVVDYLADMTNRLVNALKPRLEAANRAVN